MRSIGLIIESFKHGGGGLHKKGLLFIVANLIGTALLILAIGLTGRQYQQLDYLDMAVEGTSTLIHFALFSLISLIPLKKRIKQTLLAGLFLTQIGLLVDFLDEFIELKSAYWHIWGDLAYMVGGTVAAWGIITWVVYNYRMSTMDELTNVHNRRFFETMVRQYLYRFDRAPEDACLVCMDIDNFKKINDNFGHAKGDEVLRLLAMVLKASARKADIICRSGGEEFEILMVRANIAQASLAAHRVLEAFKEITPTGLPILTASVGITQLMQGDDIDSLRLRADTAMYQAKHGGKGRVELG